MNLQLPNPSSQDPGETGRSQSHPAPLDHDPLDCDQLDRILLDDTLLPTSGFAASVMDAILAESSAPAPIPFPWKLALPSFAAFLIALFAAFRLIAAIRRSLAAHPGLSRLDLSGLVSHPIAAHTLQAAAALAGALLCLVLTRYLAPGRSSR